MLAKLRNWIATGANQWAKSTAALPGRPEVWLTLLVTAGYFLAAHVGLAMRAMPENVAIFWPAAGLSAGTMIALGRWSWRPVAAGLMLATGLANLTGDRSPVAALAFSICNAGEALLTAWLIEFWYGPGFKLDSLRRVRGFLVAALAGPAVAALFAAAAMLLFGSPQTSFGTIWQVWFTSDAIGLVTVAPFLIGILPWRRKTLPLYSERLEGVVVLAMLALASWYIFSVPPGPTAFTVPQIILFPLLLWLAARCGPVHAAAGVIVIAIAINWTTTLGIGRLGDPALSLAARARAAHISMFVMAFATLMLAALFAERQAIEASLQSSEARYRSVVEGSMHGIAVQQEGRIVYANPAMARLFGAANAAALIGLSTFDDFVAEAERPLLRARTAAVYRGEHVNPHPGWRGIRQDGSALWVSSSAHLSEWQGRPAVVSFYFDITERQRAEDRQQILIRELDHRVKNTLARVDAIIQRSRDGAATVDQLIAALDGRLQALAHAHSMLSQSGWKGADLATLIRYQLEPYATSCNISMDGPEVLLNPDATQALTLVLHELVTNAAKHGALSTPEGQVSVHWQRLATADPAPQLLIDWQETGGPAVAPLDRTGYGSSVIRELIPYELQGSKVDFSLALAGARCRIAIPLEKGDAGQS